MSPHVGHRRLGVLWIAVAVIAIALIALPAGLLAMQATPDTESAEAELLREAEHDRLRALVEADMDVAQQLHTDDFQLINPFGETLSKEQYLGAIAAGTINYLVFEPVSEIDVRLYDQVAVIRYESHIEIDVEGQHFSDRGWHTDVYEWRDGHWQAVWSQMTRITERPT